MKKNTTSSTHMPTLSLRTGILVSLSVFFLDQIIKYLALRLPMGDYKTIIPGVFWFIHATNTGIPFGMFQGNNMLWTWIVIVIFGLLVYAHDRFTTKLSSLAYWLILGGLFGNLIDRILYGHVIDMFSLVHFAVFNVADSAITFAVLLLLYDEYVAMRTQTPLRTSSLKK